MKDLIDNKSVQFLLSFFHSYLGFCSEMTNPFSPNPNVVQLSRKKSPSRGPDLSPLGYSNNFGETSGNDFLEVDCPPELKHSLSVCRVRHKRGRSE